MKKIICLCLVFLLCFGLIGCQKKTGLSYIPDWRMETITMEPDEYEYINAGEVVEVLESGVLDLKLYSRDADAWGETVYVITDDADEWCVGDFVGVKFSKAQRPYNKWKNVRIYADKVFAYAPDAKPIIYLYPESPTLCSVKVTLNGELTCTYPAHGEHGWQNFTAYPDGTLVFPDGKEYYALYWEGLQQADWDFSKGFCVRGEDTAQFLEWALAAQGLTAREANEFIVYWLPLMQENAYSVISFQTTTYTEGVSLDITPAPDSLLRVFMAYYATDTAVAIEPQTFHGFDRHGFTVVEWGGSQTIKP
ncbi:MAG: hypothetical protein E7625_01225 [Ruminococcaceae bacterium]|nr:hypothetical protein [Oscillospiraceae bacterium]